VQLLIRSFHALKDTKTPLFITFLTVVTYLFLSWLFAFQMKLGVIGMALAITMSNIGEMLLFLYCLDQKVMGFARKAFWIPQLKMITASFFMAIFLYLPFRILDELVFDTSRTVELILLTLTTGTIGMLVYTYFAMLFDIRELYILQNILDKLGNWRKTLAKSDEVFLEPTTEGDEL